MKARVVATIERYDLFRSGDSVLIGLSGGPDSVALLHLLVSLRQKFKLTLCAVYVNHRIRPKEAASEERFCRTLCEKLHIPFEVVTRDVPALAKRQKTGLEETGRAVRYEAFEALCREKSCNKIALGHHQDDRVETMLFRLFRGTGPSGLIGIPVKRGKIIRPLYDVSKLDVLSYLKRNKLSYRVDSSNENEQFRRNFIRHSLLPQVRKALNPSVDAALLRLSDILAAEESYLDSVVRKTAVKLVSRSAGGKIQLALPRYRQYDTWLRRRLLRYCLDQLPAQGVGVDWDVIERLDTLCLQPKTSSFALPGRILAQTSKDTLFLVSPKLTPKEVTLPENGRIQVAGKTAEIRIRQRKWTRKSSIPTNRYRAVMDRVSLVLPLSIRSINIGDRFQPFGLKGSKKVGDFLTDKKVPKVLRDEISVVCDQNGIVWLPGFTIAERVKVTKETTQVVQLIYEND